MQCSWTRRAREDVHGIFDYILPFNPVAARSMRQRIHERVERLDLFPYGGRPGRVQGTRELVISGTPYIVIYRVNADTIEILRVIHGAMRWPPGAFSMSDDQ